MISGGFFMRLSILTLYRIALVIPCIRASRFLAGPASYRDPLRLVWVDPSKINFVAALGDKASKYARVFRSNSIVDGDWDSRGSDLNQNDLFVMCEKRFHEGLTWGEIPEVRKIVQGIESGRRRLKCETPKELELALEKYDAMASDIREHGFRTQKQLETGKIWDEIRLAISREGELLFINGRHRLAIAKALRLRKVPAIISIIHPRFEAEANTGNFLMEEVG